MKKEGILILVLLLIGVGAWFVMSSLLKTEGVYVDCTNGTFVRFAKISSPPFDVAQLPLCKTTLTVTDKNNLIVCATEFNSWHEETAVIPCNQIKNHKGEQLLIKFTASSKYGNYKNEVNATYG